MPKAERGTPSLGVTADLCGFKQESSGSHELVPSCFSRGCVASPVSPSASSRAGAAAGGFLMLRFVINRF